MGRSGGTPGSGKGEVSFNLLECMIWYLRPMPRSAFSILSFLK